MNKRIRSPGMCSSPSKIEEKLHRFLRPGALARLRDSRISARNPRSNPKNPSPDHMSISLPSTSDGNYEPAAAQIPFPDGFPCFDARVYGPRIPQRKKLLASRSVMFVVSESTESILDGFNVDLLVAH